jgi:hypothetical protein
VATSNSVKGGGADWAAAAAASKRAIAFRTMDPSGYHESSLKMDAREPNRIAGLNCSKIKD